MKKGALLLLCTKIGLLKQCRKGKPNSIVTFKKLSPDRSLCVYSALEEYIL